jgi:uncharacterized protein YajQ (UPF0234 family)
LDSVSLVAFSIERTQKIRELWRKWVSSKSRDELQEFQALLKSKDLDVF